MLYPFVAVLQRNVQAPEHEPGFPKWSIPDFMNCSCPHPCSFVGYTTELRNYPEYVSLIVAYVFVRKLHIYRFSIALQFVFYSDKNMCVPKSRHGLSAVFCKKKKIINLLTRLVGLLHILQSNILPHCIF